MNIEKTKFGSITIDGEKYKHDVYILLDKTVERRKKELSKPYSKGHTVVGPDEIKYLLAQKPKILVLGKGQYGILPMHEEAKKLLDKVKDLIIITNKTPVVIHLLNDLLKQKAKVVALLHVTC
ncbi:MAG: MTH938/NDUFAF3 family protein [Candidatus Heimdallarchaeota archaeon]